MHVRTGRECEVSHSSSNGVVSVKKKGWPSSAQRLHVWAPHHRGPARNMQSCNAIEIGTVQKVADTDTSDTEQNFIGADVHTGVQQAKKVKVQVLSSISQVSPSDWDSVVTNCSDEVNPFVQWAFLNALEESKSVVPQTGWLPQHITVRDASSGELLAVCPLYLKGHSFGEYVFDQSWAELSTMLGEEYYPKLQACVPFTPVTGPRMAVKRGPDSDLAARALVQTLVGFADALDVSSLHLTFNSLAESSSLEAAGFLTRSGIQFHWHNRGYASFEDFLASLRQSKRKSIRQERKSVSAQGLRLARRGGRDIPAADWDAFYEFYSDTADRKDGTAYLTREFFHMLGEALPDEVLLVSAHEGDCMVAGALNLVGSHALYGRNWGCAPGREFKNLHFELCYYQALEEAISRQLPRVEAGAQGEHKLQRGYLPTTTYSSHLLRSPSLRYVVTEFLHRERQQIDFAWQALTVQASPYKEAATIQHLMARGRPHLN